MIHFLGNSYAAVTLKEAARRRGLKLTDKLDDLHKADLIFLSEDMPTDAAGNRIPDLINEYIEIIKNIKVPKVITSQVVPSFMRNIKQNDLYHQAETLRIEDGMQRAMYPEMFIVGKKSAKETICNEYKEYLEAFECPIFEMTYEEAEFCKIAINMRLISQVENTNLLSQAAERVGADWGKIAQALRHDSRIGKFSYLTPGDWRKSKHLLRDYVTLNEIL